MSVNPAGITIYEGWYALAYALVAEKETNVDDALKAVLGYKTRKDRRHEQRTTANDKKS